MKLKQSEELWPGESLVYSSDIIVLQKKLPIQSHFLHFHFHLYIIYLWTTTQFTGADYFLFCLFDFCFFIFNVFTLIAYLLLKALKKNKHFKNRQSINIWIPGGRKHIIKGMSRCQAKAEWLIMLIAHLPNFYKKYI